MAMGHRGTGAGSASQHGGGLGGFTHRSVYVCRKVKNSQARTSSELSAPGPPFRAARPAAAPSGSLASRGTRTLSRGLLEQSPGESSKEPNGSLERGTLGGRGLYSPERERCETIKKKPAEECAR